MSATSFAASASTANASITLGQLAPGAPPPANCTAPLLDLVQPTVTSGNTYVAPVAGTITSWNTNAAAGSGQHLFMKVFRKVGEPKTWMVVGQDGPQPLNPSSLNTFPANVAVKAGDVLGLNDGDANIANNACAFDSLGELYDAHMGNLANGQSADFIQGGGARLNITAVLDPTNTVSLGTSTRNKKRGTATLAVDVPNPGELVLSGNGVKSAGAGPAVAATTVTAPGTVELLVKAQGKKKRKLKAKGKVNVSPTITFTPTGGEPKATSVTLRLIRR